MESTDPIRCRVAACREELDDGKSWSFYLINDCDAPLDLAELYAIDLEWGGMPCMPEAANVRVVGLAPGAHALIWRDDGNGAELCMELSLRVQVRSRKVELKFEFPKLYLRRNLPLVDDLGKPGLQVAAEGRNG